MNKYKENTPINTLQLPIQQRPQIQSKIVQKIDWAQTLIFLMNFQHIFTPKRKLVQKGSQNKGRGKIEEFWPWEPPGLQIGPRSREWVHKTVLDPKMT